MSGSEVSVPDVSATDNNAATSQTGQASVTKSRILLLGNKADMVLKNRGELLRHWCALGHGVHAAAPDLPDSPVAAALRDWGVTLHHVDLDRRSRNPLTELASLRDIYRLCRNIAPSHLLAYTIKPSMYGPLAARLAGVRQSYCIITGVGFIFASEPHSQLDRVMRMALRRVDRMAKARCAAIFYQNPDDLGLLRDCGVIGKAAKVVRIYGSGVNLDSFSPTFKNTAPPAAARAKGRVFTMIARFLADKGIREYVDAARRIRARFPDAVCRLIGELDVNPEAITAGELETWTDIIDIMDWVEDVRPQLAETDVFVLPSYREGTPKSVLEAMAMGVPIITTDVPGCRETIDDGVSGILVPPRDAASLADAMARFATDPALAPKMGRAARIKAERVFDVNIVVDTITRTMGLQHQSEIKVYRSDKGGVEQDTHP